MNFLPQVTYTRDDLLNIVETHPHPAIRRIAGEMLHTMGKRDLAAERVPLGATAPSFAHATDIGACSGTNGRVMDDSDAAWATTPKQRASVLARFWQKVARNEGGCWIWNAALSTSGYGKFYVSGHLIQASRVSWMAEYGAIPKGLFVLHRCDVRRCVNPAHLFLGTARDNTLDMLAKKRHVSNLPKGLLHPKSKLSEESVREIRSSNERVSIAARKYGVTMSAITKIRTGQTWKHLS